jgi:hypothetical protein
MPQNFGRPKEALMLDILIQPAQRSEIVLTVKLARPDFIAGFNSGKSYRS